MLVPFAVSPGAAQTTVLSAPLNPRAQVVIARDPEATRLFEPAPARVSAMFNRALKNLTGTTQVSAAWLSLVSTQDVIGIKVVSWPGAVSGTRPALVAAMVQGLLTAGIPPRHIIIWDKRESDLRTAGFFDLAQRLGVRAAGGEESGYDPNTFYDSPLIGSLLWGDFEFGSHGDTIGRKSFITKLLTQETTKTINVTPLLNNNLVGVCGNLYSLAMGAVDNSFRFESAPERLARAVPEIYALPQLGDRVVLNVTDALLCQYEGSERSLLHYSTVLNELRLSRDPVALDVLSLQELEKQRQAAHAAIFKPNLDLYSNATLLELGVSDPEKISVETLH